MSLWVAELAISDRTAQKIINDHHVSPQEIRDLLVCRAGLLFSWDDHSERGTRAIVNAYLRGRPMLIVLYPVEGHPLGDAFNLGSAYFID